jgi:hypothetical protein
MAAALARRQRPPSHHPRLFRVERGNDGLSASSATVNRSQADAGTVRVPFGAAGVFAGP